MGMAFKPDIDDLRESPARYIISRVMEKCPEAEYMVVEPYVDSVKGYELTSTADAWATADIVAFLTAHTPFKSLDRNDRADRIVLDFAGVYK